MPELPGVYDGELPKTDLHVLLDRSGSMQEHRAGARSYWELALTKLGELNEDLDESIVGERSLAAFPRARRAPADAQEDCRADPPYSDPSPLTSSSDLSAREVGAGKTPLFEAIAARAAELSAADSPRAKLLLVVTDARVVGLCKEVPFRSPELMRFVGAGNTIAIVAPVAQTLCGRDPAQLAEQSPVPSCVYRNTDGRFEESLSILLGEQREELQLVERMLAAYTLALEHRRACVEADDIRRCDRAARTLATARVLVGREADRLRGVKAAPAKLLAWLAAAEDALVRAREAIVHNLSRPVLAVEPNESVVAVHGAGGAKCSGTLVGDRLVLTAAHCLPATQVSVGVDARRPRRRVAVRAAAPAPDDDVALLLLSRPVAEATLPLTRRARAEPPQSPLRVGGYGATEARGQLGAGRRRMVDLPPAARWGCSTTRAASFGCRAGRDLVLPGGGGRDTCRGDSGGPVLERVCDGARARWRVIAVTSRPLANARVPCGHGGIYTRTDVLSPWLQAQSADFGVTLDWED